MPIRLSDLRKTADATIDADGLDSAQVTTIASGVGLTYFSTLDSLPTSSLTAGDQAFVAATQRLYISNGVGWYNVSLINLTPQFDSDINSTFDIVDSQTPLVITNPASDSDNPDAIITYGGTMSDSGQYLVALTRDSSVWTFTPLSADSVYNNVTLGNLSDSNGGDFTYTFSATDNINTATKTVTITYEGLTAAANIGLGSTAGYTSGRYYDQAYNQIQKISFASDTNGTDVGDQSLERTQAAGMHSVTHGYAAGGYDEDFNTYTNKNVIDKFPFASEGNATDVGDTAVGITARAGGHQSPTNGYVSGGFVSPDPSGNPQGYTNMIQIFPFASDTNATDNADLDQATSNHAYSSSGTHGYTAGGVYYPAPVTIQNQNAINKFTFASAANATDVGDLGARRFGLAGQQSSTHGYVAGGAGSPPATTLIQKYSFSSDGNASDVGALTVARYFFAGNSSTTHGYSSAGREAPGTIKNEIDKFPYAADASATDVGDLNRSRDHAGNIQV